MHSNTLAAALHAAGSDVVMVPLYTPVRTDEQNVSISRVAFGGINVYLQERSALFRRTPWFLDRLLDRPGLIRWAAKGGATIRPDRLGRLTVSMLRGEEGRQRKELEKLLRWLETTIQPDLIHLSNVLLAGMARRLHERLGVPVVCTLAGEDLFLERLPTPYHAQARAELRRRCGDLAAMIAMNRYYAGFMAEYLSVPAERIHVVRPGLNLGGHATRPRTKRRSGAVTVGYLARVCPEKGLHLLAEALCRLAEDPDLPQIRLRAAGYLDETERPYLGEIEKRLADRGLADRFEYLGELDRPAKIALLQSLDVMSMPTLYRESKGLPVLEAWANGVPVVVPSHGAFPELIDETGGGLLCEPDNPQALAAALKRLICNADLAAACGRRAQQAVHERFGAEQMARRTIDLYEKVCRT